MVTKLPQKTLKSVQELTSKKKNLWNTNFSLESTQCLRPDGRMLLKYNGINFHQLVCLPIWKSPLSSSHESPDGVSSSVCAERKEERMWHHCGWGETPNRNSLAWAGRKEMTETSLRVRWVQPNGHARYVCSLTGITSSENHEQAAVVSLCFSENSWLNSLKKVLHRGLLQLFIHFYVTLGHVCLSVCSSRRLPHLGYKSIHQGSNHHTSWCPRLRGDWFFFNYNILWKAEFIKVEL